MKPQVNDSIFKSYDIRAIYPDEINEENIVVIANAIYKFFQTKLVKETVQVALGYDMRLSSPSLFKAAKDTLIGLGAQVIDVGLISTPTFYFAVFKYKYETGIQITASHNPKDYNGAKIVINSPKGLVKIGKSTGMDQVKSFAKSDDQINLDKKGSLTSNDYALTDEIKNALNLFSNPQFKKFKVVSDSANAMGILYINELFEKIDSDLIRLNDNLDGSFPSHPPDPLDHNNLTQLIAKVKETSADFGIAPDGDGDRLFFIDELGQIVPPSVITAIISEELLKEYPGSTILFDIRYVLTAINTVEKLGGKYKITKVGHAYITEEMAKTNAIFAGESSAHYFYKATGNAESQAATVVCVMKVLSEQNLTLSNLVKKYKYAFESGEINFTVNDKTKIIDELKKIYQDGTLNELDGIAISFDDWRFSLRSSNTEPLLRLNIESLDEKILSVQKGKIIKIIEDLKNE